MAHLEIKIQIQKNDTTHTQKELMNLIIKMTILSPLASPLASRKNKDGATVVESKDASPVPR